jgi:protein-tyrosine kinase
MTGTEHLTDIPTSQRALAAILVDECHMPVEAQQEILVIMRRDGLSFTEAALARGLVTQAEIESATVKASEAASYENSSVVQKAINRVARSRHQAFIEGEKLQASSELFLAHNPDHPRSEQLRALRTELLIQDITAGRSKRIATISPSNGEGRSHLSAELAVAFSQLGRPALLIDADLRNPKQHVLFNSENRYGLSQALVDLEAPILNTVEGLPFLAVLTSGHLTGNPLELLSGGRLTRLMDTLSATFDFIIVDTPPISQYADGIAVATVAGSVIITSRAAHTTFKDMRDLLKRLGPTRAQIMGTVLSHF